MVADFRDYVHGFLELRLQISGDGFSGLCVRFLELRARISGLTDPDFWGFPSLWVRISWLCERFFRVTAADFRLRISGAMCTIPRVTDADFRGCICGVKHTDFRWLRARISGLTDPDFWGLW